MASSQVGLPAADVNGRATVSRFRPRWRVVGEFQLNAARSAVLCRLLKRSHWVHPGMRRKRRSCATVLGRRPVDYLGTARNERCSHVCLPHELAGGDDRGLDLNADVGCSPCSRRRPCRGRRPTDDTGFAYGNDALARGWSFGCASGGRTARWDSASTCCRRPDAFARCQHCHVACDSPQAAANA